MTRTFAALHARALAQDEQGLTILAYALGAAAILVPMASAIYLFGTSMTSDARDIVDNAIS